jgi:cell division protein FtsZ
MEMNHLNFEFKRHIKSKIKVIGVGGGGGNALKHMFNTGVEGVDFVICNTDLQALENNPVENKIQLGKTLTDGLGAGSIPNVGREAAIESTEELYTALDGTKMLFITAGMGGGTGTGASPIIAQIAKEMGLLTVAVVTTPFRFEGPKRHSFAQQGLEELKKNVDAYIIINNEQLKALYGNLTLSSAFNEADNILLTAVKGIAEIITQPGLVNVDLNDVTTVMKNSGAALMGYGKAEGDRRAINAIEEAVQSPLLNTNDISGANYILLNISSGNDEISMDEISDITDYVTGEETNIMFGTTTDPSLGESIAVTIIAAGFEKKAEVEESVEHAIRHNALKASPSIAPEVKSFENKPMEDKQSLKQTSIFDVIHSEKAKKQAEQQQPILPKIEVSKPQPMVFESNKPSAEIQSSALNYGASDEDKIKSKIEKLKGLSPNDKWQEDDLRFLEDVPAYKAKGIKFEGSSYPEANNDSMLSRSTIESDEFGKSSIRFSSNNNFLHGNVD